MIEAAGEEFWKHRSKNDEGSGEPEQQQSELPGNSWHIVANAF